ncbi:MAG: response regulator transcription factor [Cyclobacteriaceae bacterium]
MPKNILLIDDHVMIREAIKQFLKDTPEYVITAEAENGKQALDLIKKRSFDLIITDINMPVMSGIELMENIRLNFPKQLVLVISMHDDENSVKKMVGLGARGYLLKNSKKEIFINAIEALFNGKKYYPIEIRQRLESIIRKQKTRKQTSRVLSPIEEKVLQVIWENEGKNIAAGRLRMTIKEVDNVLNQLFLKTNCNSIPGLTVYALEQGLI